MADTSEEDYSDSGSDGESQCDITLTEAEEKEIVEEIKNAPKRIKVVCCGPTGVGKSTLLNGLMGVNDFSDEAFDVGESLQRGTVNVLEKTIVKNEIAITLVDTPGLEGSRETDHEYLREIQQKCSNFDLFLYCIRSTESRSTELFDDKSSLVKFTQIFGVQLWKKAVVILTQANALESDYEEEKEVDENFNVEEAFCARISEWGKKIREELMKRGVQQKTVKKLPILPAGSATSPHLPGYPFWLSKIFEKVNERMAFKAKLAYLKFSRDRLREKKNVNVEEMAGQDICDQPLIYNNKVIAGAAIGGGAASAAVGGSIGATVGALAIGIPSFGVFAGLGLVLGFFGGAAVGVGASIATAMAARFFKRRKMKKMAKKKKT